MLYYPYFNLEVRAESPAARLKKITGAIDG